MRGWRKPPLRRISYGTAVIVEFKWQYMTGAGAKIMDKGGAKKKPEPKINNFGSATLEFII